MSNPFADLTPDTVMNAVESLGYYCDARIYPLNSYENRVYQVGIEESRPLIAKFYRPQRWSSAQIREEHAWTMQLAEADVEVVAPICIANETLFHCAGFDFALYTKSPGSAVSLDDDNHLFALGQAVGRLHQEPARLFTQRNSLNPVENSHESRDFLLTGPFLPQSLHASYRKLTDGLIAEIKNAFETVNYELRPLHGDFHAGNVLWDSGPVIVDFDDAHNGPAVQDLWMLLSGDQRAQQRQLQEVLDGYEEYCQFDSMQLKLIPSLRALRLMHYSAWLAKRWQDSAFPKAFPWFNAPGYWDGHLKQLAQACAEIKTHPFKRGQPW